MSMFVVRVHSHVDDPEGDEAVFLPHGDVVNTDNPVDAALAQFKGANPRDTKALLFHQNRHRYVALVEHVVDRTVWIVAVWPEGDEFEAEIMEYDSLASDFV